jgi:phosphoribosylformylglycinamidine (FGAM) synthase-like enzyme/phosphoribosylformylglycinamidine (FGAM) synthase PurS component
LILKIHKIREGKDPEASRLRMELSEKYPSLTDLRIEKVLRTEGLTKEELSKFRLLFAHPVIENFSSETMLDPTKGSVIEVSYQRAMTDPELNSIRHAAANMNIGNLIWARISNRYQFEGLSKSEAEEIVSRYLCNRQIQVVIPEGEEWLTLVPQGAGGPVEYFDLGIMDLKALRKMSDQRRLLMSDAKLLAMQKHFLQVEKRPARDGEIEMVAAGWSDHCYHETWKAMGLLQALQQATKRINHPMVVSWFVDNSGVISFYDGWAINFKGETHISPIFGGSPKGGEETKHGGVIRDVIFTGEGAYPIWGTTVVATCDPHLGWDVVPLGAQHPQVVLREVIQATSDYCNPMGIPTGWSEYLKHPRNWKGFSLGHSVGILPEGRAAKGEPLPGDFVVLIGGPTGLDGLHGATVSSGATTSETSTRDAAHVQIGMPIEQRKFMEAIPNLRDADCIRACTDCGAAGLASAFGEIASSCGGWINLAWVHLKSAGMSSWEKLLSESQERGVLAVPADKLEHALSLLERYDVSTAVVGVFTGTGRCQVVDNPSMDYEQFLVDRYPEMVGEIVVDLPYSFLSGGCPLPTYTLKESDKNSLSFPKPYEFPVPKREKEWIKLVTDVLGHYNICDQTAAAHRYDQTVQGATVMSYISGYNERMPDELFVKAPIFGKPYGVGGANAVNQYYGEVDPAAFGRLMLASAITKLVAAGFAPKDIGGFCANVYTPPVDDPENAWRLDQLVKHGYVPGTEEIGIPVISGKDSSSGRFVDKKTGNHIDAPLTLDVYAVGRTRDVRNLITKPFKSPGDSIVLYSPGLKSAELGGSILYDLHDQRGDRLSKVDLSELRDGLSIFHSFRPLVRSRSAIAEGGLIRRLFECSFGSGLGCTVNIDGEDPLKFLFAETHGSILFTIPPTNEWDDSLWPGAKVIGYVNPGPYIMVEERYPGDFLFMASVAELSVKWSKTFAEVAR